MISVLLKLEKIIQTLRDIQQLLYMDRRSIQKVSCWDMSDSNVHYDRSSQHM